MNRLQRARSTDPAETDEARAARIAEEDRLCDEAEAERLGTIPGDEAHAWFRSPLTDTPLPRPKPRHE